VQTASHKKLFGAKGLKGLWCNQKFGGLNLLVVKGFCFWCQGIEGIKMF